jgi:CheY-like chemotaxis protein
MAEPTQLHQIIVNLFTNAVHAIGNKTGTIKLELDDFIVNKDFAKIHPDIKVGKHIMLRVSDTGKGIEQKNLEKIFEPFFTTKSHGEGTGLGLSVVHGIVKKLGGAITAYSEVGKGTVFNMIIPIVETDDVKQNQEVVSVREGTERIVIIDDEKAITATMQSILSNLGYRVTTFTDGLAALAEIKSSSNNFDIIITDYSMPEITGLELTKELKKSGIRTPVILASGYVEENIKSAALNAGVSTVIAKPINTYQLTDAIHRVSEKLL